MPFHYGYGDKQAHARAANELTITEGDSVSKQPYVKYAVKIKKISNPNQKKTKVNSDGTVKEDLEKIGEQIIEVVSPSKPPVQHVADYIGMLDCGEQKLAEALLKVAEHHKNQLDIYEACKLLASWSQTNAEKLKPFIESYSEKREEEPAKLSKVLFKGPRDGEYWLLRDLQDLFLFASENNVSWVILMEAAFGLRDKQLIETCREAHAQSDRQIAWLLTRIKQTASQALIIPS